MLKKLIYWAVKKLNTRVLEKGKGLQCEVKWDFEADIIAVLEKYKLHDNKQSSIQRVEIVCEVDNHPKIKLTTLLLKKMEKKEETE